MKRNGTELLLRDLAALFLKYRLEDWEPILSQLGSGSSLQKEISNAIKQGLDDAAKQANIRKKEAKRKAPKKNLHRDELPAPIIAIKRALASRTLLGDAGSLREAALSIGIKADLPSKRSEAIKIFIEYLSPLPDDQRNRYIISLANFQKSIQGDLAVDYERWFNVIRGDQIKL